MDSNSVSPVSWDRQVAWKLSRKDRECNFCGQPLPKGRMYFRCFHFAFCDEECAEAKREEMIDVKVHFPIM